MRISERNMRRRNAQKKSGVKFSAIFVIIVISILAGYLTTRFIVYPIIGHTDTSILTKLQNLFKTDKVETEKGNGDNEEDKSADDPNEDEQGVIDDGLTVKDGDNGGATSPAASSGYSMQFGSFSTKGAAEKLISQLRASGISAEIVEKDGAYKVLGELFDTKEEAAMARQQLGEEEYGDVFITERQENK